MKKKFILGIIAFILFIGASVYITFPLIFHMTDFVNGELVIAWIMNWNIYALMHGIWPYFNTNIFFPYHNTLAYSDLFFTSSLIALPFFVIFHEPMLPSNITFLTSLIFLGFFTYILIFYITKNFLTSVLSGILIVFSPVVLDKRYHLQILAIEWIPLAIVFFLHFIKSKKYNFLFFSLLCFIFQTYNSFMAGYFLIFSYVGIIISYFLIDRKVIYSIFKIKTLLFFIFSFLIIIPITIPYFQVSHEFNFVRDIRETIHLALQPEDLLVTNDMSRFKPLLWFFDSGKYPPSAEVKPGFLGFVFTILSIISIIYVLKNLLNSNNKKKNLLLYAFSSIAFFGLILSFGPAFHLGRVTVHHPFLIPLPYALAYYVLPGFKGIRDSSRFEMLFVLLMAAVIGIVMDKVLKNKNKIMVIIIYIILLAGVIGEYKNIQYEKAYTFENFPLVYSWIEKNTPKDAVIIEMPIYNWDNNPFGDNREVLREYFSTLHFRKLISGGSGFSPPPWQEFAKKEFIDFPSKKAIDAIRGYRVTYLIIHADEFDILHKIGYKAGNHIVYSSQDILSSLSQNSQLQFIIKQGNSYVYKFK